MREFEDRFMQLGLPYRVIGGPRFYERAEIRDANAYLRLIAQPDDDLALKEYATNRDAGLAMLLYKIFTAQHAVIQFLSCVLPEF